MNFAIFKWLPLIGLLLVFSPSVIAKESIWISDYHPSQFIERAESPFFYSIGKRLKYGSSIDESAPTLFEGSWLNGDIVSVYVSPDNQKAAVISNRKLYIARAGRAALLALANVDNYEPKKLSNGDVYFKWPTLQWHPNSQFIYIAKDKKQKPWEQTFSKEAILVRIDIEDVSNVKELINDFRSMSYFFVGTDNVCFDYAPGDGSVIWRCSTANGLSRVRSMDRTDIHLDNGVVLNDRPFFSYEPNIYESSVWMARYGFSIRRISERQDALFHKDVPNTPLLTFNTGRNIKGHRVNGIGQMGGSVLPGGRYLLLNMALEGQFLLDRVSRGYRKLPKETRVYRNLNSTSYEGFTFSINAGRKPNDSFIPDSRVLP